MDIGAKHGLSSIIPPLAAADLRKRGGADRNGQNPAASDRNGADCPCVPVLWVPRNGQNHHGQADEPGHQLSESQPRRPMRQVRGLPGHSDGKHHGRAVRGGQRRQHQCADRGRRPRRRSGDRRHQSGRDQSGLLPDRQKAGSGPYHRPCPQHRLPPGYWPSPPPSAWSPLPGAAST